MSGHALWGEGAHEPLGKSVVARAVGITSALVFDYVSGVPEDLVKQYMK